MGLQFTGAGAEAFAKTRPGQFAQFDLSNIALLRRKRYRMT